MVGERVEVGIGPVVVAADQNEVIEIDVLTGGSDADTFVFENGTREDDVTDFEDGVDQLDVSAFFDDAADAVAAARQDGADTVIELDLGAGDSVRLVGVDLGQIDETDFLV